VDPEVAVDPGGAAFEVRRLLPADVSTVSVSLAKAFRDDPVSAYLFPKDGRRLRQLVRYFRFQVSVVFLPRGECWTTTGLEGAALWMPPRSAPPTVREAMAQLPILAILGRRTNAAVKLVRFLEENHPRTPHFYLGTIGTEPDSQRRGVGSALMLPVLQRCDEQGLPAYLESSKFENLAFYHRHGFEVVKQLTVPDADLTLWLMWREPKPPEVPGAGSG